MDEVKDFEDGGDAEESDKVEEKPRVKKTLNYKFFFFIFSFLIILVLIFFNVRVANPDSKFFYNFKRLYEKTQLQLKSNSQDKLNYQYELLDKRLEELVYIVEGGISPYVLTTSLRYSTTAGQITELIIDNNLKDESQRAKEKLENHLDVVRDLPQKYPKAGDEAKFIIDDANYLITYIDLLSSFSSK